MKFFEKAIEKFEKFITHILIFLMVTVISLAVVDLAWLIIKDCLSPPILLLEIDELLDLFGMFLVVMIGIELIETLKAYSQNREVRTQVIILVAIIALARKIVILDLKVVPILSLLGLAAILIALAAAYYLIKKISS